MMTAASGAQAGPCTGKTRLSLLNGKTGWQTGFNSRGKDVMRAVAGAEGWSSGEATRVERRKRSRGGCEVCV